MADNDSGRKLPDNKNPNNNDNKKSNLLTLFLIILIALCGFGLVSNMDSSDKSKEITYDKFINYVKEDRVDKVVLEDGKLTVTVHSDKDKDKKALYNTNLVGDENSLVEMLSDKNVVLEKKSEEIWVSVLYSIASIALPLVIFVFFMNMIMKKSGGGMMGIGKSKAKSYVQQDTGVTFEDVAGEDEAKESLQEMVDFLHNPDNYTKIGAKLPKGALLVGPPGTGKTLLAKAVAGEAHVPFFSLSGSEFVEMFVGVGASRVRDLFDEAKKQAPCIIFIDEIDAIGKTRDSRFGGNDEREQTLNQLLAEMDGFDSSKAILILAATNRPEILDPALLRPGRFDRRVIVDRPDLKGRIAILKVHAKKVLLDDTVDFNEIALATSGVVGSDLANMVNEAAILAVKHGRKAVSQKDLFESVEVVLVGKEKKDRILSQEERRIVSYHEVGHALITALDKNAEPVQKITIVPRTMGALGYVMQVPEEEKYLNTKAELQTMIVGFLGGRAAEEIVFGNVTTGASNDIEKATKLCRDMITRYGMSEKFGLMGLEQQENQYLDGRTYLTCGDATATEIDHEIMKMLSEAYEKAKKLLSDNRDILDKIAEYLILKETITGKEFMELYHKAIDEREEDTCPSISI
ncbi:MAG: ATP-dependent zinc metalloprotease FtsH [Candidatus Alectryocaccobium sp.]|nr:ATP-dependent zinc metalloprotease FtsH [Lachnospiraceae bacterium]MDY6222433.1 ATP-dependent zinc metalloprotease FtsH [Candidatus Alectryocaccobium sp.]